MRTRFARLTTAITSPIEGAIEFIGRKLFRGFERVEGVESLLLGFGRALTWPFRVLGRLLRAIFAVLTPRWLARGIRNIFKAYLRLQRKIVAAAVWIGEALNLDVAFLFLARITRPLWYPFVAIIYFCYALAATRSLKRMVWGLLAVFLVLPIPVVLAWSTFGGTSRVAGRYQVTVKQALEDKDYARAQLFERKLAQLGVDTNLSEFNTALALERQGNVKEAFERMQRLAPTDSPGYPQAHLWIITHLLGNKLGASPADTQTLIGKHLDQLAAMEVKGADVDIIRAHWLSQAGRREEAATLLEPLVHRNHAAAVEKFAIDLSLSRRDDARRDALELRAHMQRQERQDAKSLTSGDYQWWAAAEELLGNKAILHRLLAASLERDLMNPAARTSMAALSLREFDETMASPTPDPKLLSQCLLTAFELGTPTENMKQRVGILYQNRTNRPALQGLFEILTGSKHLPPALAETLGTAAAVEGNWKQAEVFLADAVAKDPTNAVAWNNYACALLQKQSPPLDTALNATNKALADHPDDFRFRETRGEVYVRLGRWKEAIDDLEYALNGTPENPVVHRALAKAYEALGNKELAAVHSQYAN